MVYDATLDPAHHDALAVAFAKSTTALTNKALAAEHKRVAAKLREVPVPTPTPTPVPPAPTPTGRQPLYYWGSFQHVAVDSPSNLALNAAALNLIAAGVKGILIDRAKETNTDDWVGNVLASYRTQTGVTPGLIVHVPAPGGPLSDPGDMDRMRKAAYQAVRSGGKLYIDCEPGYYQGDGSWWRQSRSQAAGAGVTLGQTMRSVGCTSLGVYTSSDAGLVGSWAELIQLANGNPDYSPNTLGDFLGGVAAQGVTIQLTDASFHYGPVLSGYTWETAIVEAKRLFHVRYPAAAGHGYSPMLWPGIVEWRAPYTVTEMTTAMDAAARLSDSPVTIFAREGLGELPSYLPAITGALS